MNQYTPLRERFDVSYTIDQQTGCWTWKATISQTNKWGDVRPLINVNGKAKRAYRVSYELFVGPIPEGLWVLHKCDNSICVNPDHLYCGTPADNANDMITRERATWQKDPQSATARGHQLQRWKQKAIHECKDSRGNGHCGKCGRFLPTIQLVTVRIGQVYRDRYATRYVKVLQPVIKRGVPAFWCHPCDESGATLSTAGLGRNNIRKSRIPEERLKRFELVAVSGAALAQLEGLRGER